MPPSPPIPTSARALRELVSLVRPGASRLVKSAGPTDEDVPFEQAFANLAHSVIRDRAPKLLDYELGFQMLEKNEDGTRAAGVFGFKVGPTTLYAPVFFLNGEIKGRELLYVKNQDLFVPMDEAWVNYLLGKKPGLLGEGVEKNLSQLGVIGSSLYQISRSPYKYASAPGEWRTGACAAVARAVTTSPSGKCDGLRGVVDFLKEAGERGFRALADLVRARPSLAAEFDRHYGEGFLWDPLESTCRHASLSIL